MKKSDFRSSLERIEALPAARREKIEAGAAKVLENMHLADIRKALHLTQAQAAERSGLKQSEVSRIERSPETVQLRTLWHYASSLGGSARVVLDFPDGTSASVGLHRGKLAKTKVAAKA